MTRRLLASYLLLTLAVLAALEIPLAINYRQRLESELTGALTKDAFAIAGFSEETVEGAASADLGQLARSYSERTGARVVIVDQTGRELADSQRDTDREDFTNREEIATALSGQVATGVRHSDTLGGDLLYVAVPIASSGVVHGAARISYSTAQLDDRVRSYWLGLAGIAAISLAAAAVLGVLFARWVSRPLEQLDVAARGLTTDLSVRAPSGQGPPEVRELAEAFNTMAARLEQLVTAQESFVADASHQLRTPLAALRLRLENLQDAAEHLPGGVDVADDLRDDLDAARTEVLRLGRIVDGLLALARADRATLADSAERLSVADVLAARTAAWEPVADEHGVRLQVERVPLYVRATPDRLAQALDNLVANAIEATPAGRAVRLTARPVADGDHSMRIELHVTDEGRGMTDEERDRAFDRFWRARQERSSLGGSGIGLSIVQKLVQADAGSVELRSADGGGLDAVISLPPG
ncbi:MAG: ATP-binding protein [Acidimicrobiales bacterium]